MRDAVRDQLLPLEQQAVARRASDHLATTADPTEGQLHQAAARSTLLWLSLCFGASTLLIDGTPHIRDEHGNIRR
jgi:hypothetical protein